jgi:hypothetical protein
MRFATIKIAAGVFLGILAAYSVYLALQMWERSEQQRLDSAQQQARAMKEQELISNAALSISWLTPEELTAHCGEPLQESRTTSRALHYLGADGRRIHLSFHCTDGKCYFDEMERDSSNQYSAEYNALHSTNYEWFAYKEKGQQETKIHLPDHKDQVKELPCLAGLPQ